MDEMNVHALQLGKDWSVFVEAQIKSGQSAVGFCREHGIGYTNFLYHRDKIQKANRLEVAM